MSVGPNWAMSGAPGQPGSQPTRRLAHPVCPENEIRVTPIRIVGTSGCLASFALPLSKCLVNRDSELNRVVPEWRIFLRGP